MTSEMSAPIDRVPDLVKALFALVAELEELFPGRKFTPDGHLVGSIGEVLAAHLYDLKLASASTEGYDAQTSDRRKVEIKATQGRGVALRSQPEHLIVLALERTGSVREVYNGPGALVWERCGNAQKNGQRQISLARLRKLMLDVPAGQRLLSRIPPQYQSGERP